MRKVLVTGADGFIGSHLTEMLLKQNYKVKALSFYNSFNYWGWLEDLSEKKNLEIVTGDIRDPYLIKNLMNGVDMVFNLAALIAIPYSYIAPESYVDTNIRGTLNICQAAKELGGIRVIHTSTSEVYGTAQYIPIDEKHPRQAQSPYSASKIGADAMALSYYHSFNLPLTIVRPFNTYGPRQSARAIIPSIITQIASGAKQIKLGYLSSTRDFNFVLDTCTGLIAIAESSKSIGREINIASNSEISIMDLFEEIKNIMGNDADAVIDEKRLRPDKSEVFRLCGDNSLLKEITTWQPSYSMDEGLRITVNWFSDPDNLKKYKPGIYNI
jgi:NAD dependent epimerase/dehydratase